MACLICMLSKTLSWWMINSLFDWIFFISCTAVIVFAKFCFARDAMFSAVAVLGGGSCFVPSL